MALPPGVRDIGQAEGDAIGLARLERLRLFKAMAEFASERFTADQLLISAHLDCVRRTRRRVSISRCGRATSATRWRSVVVGIIGREDVDYFHHEIRIGTTC